MFDRLLESKRSRERRLAGTVVSVAAHAAIGILAVVATMRADPPAPDPETLIEIHYPPTDDPGPAETPRVEGDAGGGSPAPRTPAPTDIPIEIGEPIETVTGPITVIGPIVDLDSLLGADARTHAVAGRGAGGDALTPSDGIYNAARVERIAAPRPGNPVPAYPEILRRAHVEGRVVARFVVDTSGRIEMASVRILHEDHPLFTAAVRATLPRLRFSPARLGERPVRMMAEMPFVFELER